MKIISLDLNKDYTPVLLEALHVLKHGGSIVYPTDTVYGLGANACEYSSVDLIFRIKKRPMTKPLPIIAKNMKWVRELAFVPPKLEKKLETIWPGATTIVLPKKKILPAILTSDGPNVGIRIPDFAFTDKLLGKFGYPLTSTMANLLGEDAAGDINSIIESFRGQIWKPDLILDAGKLPQSKPSTLLDLSKIRPKILRVGPSKPEQIMKILDIT